MEIIGATEAQANFADLLRQVSTEGERIAIERCGKPCAALVPIEDLKPTGAKGEQAIQVGEQRFRDFVDASSDWFWEMDENCRFSYVSGRFTEVTGVPVEALLGKTREETGIPGLDAEVWERHLADLAARRSFRDFRHPRTRSDGQEVQLSINGKAVFDGADNFMGYRGTGTDITEHMQVEKNLRASEAALAKAQRQAKIGSWHWSVKHNELISASEEYARIHGVGMDDFKDLLSDYVERAIHPDDRARVVREFKRVDEECVAYNIEYRILRSDGELWHVQEIGEPVLDASGRAIEQTGITQDITARKDAEQALTESEGPFRGVFDLGLIGMAILSPAGRFQQVNRAYCKFIGYNEDELIGKHFNQVIHPDDLEGVTERLRQLLAGEVEGNHHDRRYRHKEGHEVWGTAGLFVLDNPDGAPRNVVVQVQDITARKRAEGPLRLALKALNVSQAQLRAVFDNTPVCLNLKDTEGRYLLINKPYEEWLGHSAEEIIGKKASEFLTSGTEIEDLSAAEKIVLETGEPFEREVSVERADGRIYHRILIKYPVKGADGPVGAIGTIAVDVTDRREIEDKLKELNEELEERVRVGIDEVREIESRYRHAFENAPIGVALITPEGNRFQVNQALADFLGYSIEELKDSTMKSTAGDADDLDKSMILRQKVLDGEIDTYRNERRYQHKDGHIVWGEVTGALYRKPNGEPEHFIAHTIDITERKQAEEKLRESERRLQAAAKMAKVGYFIWDLVEDRCLYCSEEYARIHGMSVEAYMDGAATLESDSQMVHPEDRARYQAEMKSTLESGEIFELEYRILGKDGKVHYVREKENFSEFKDGVAITTEGTVQDITEIKQAEEQLQQAQKMETVGQLTGGVAHDFNNLLAVIQGNAELLAIEGRGDATLTAPIIRAARRGGELTQRLLAFSRQQPLKPQVISFGALVSDMSDLLTRTLGETIEIGTSAPVNLWSALADPGQVENALLNLALNARDAMPNGGKLTIECANAQLGDAYAAENSEIAAGDYVVLTVTDEGSGMSAEVQAHAFEPFFTTKEVGEGSGLGLSMVYGFAKQSGGHVNIDSEAGKGTTVKLYLPRATEAKQTKRESQGVGIVPRGRGEVILVVEDDPDVRTLAVQMLESLGYRAIEAADAAAAHKVLADGQQVDLVLSDVMLPGGTSGPEFVDQARAAYPGIKIIFMSGYPAEAAMRNGFLGSDDVLLNKPFKMQQLTKALREALG